MHQSQYPYHSCIYINQQGSRVTKRNKKYNLIYGVITIITIIALSFIGEKVSSDNIGNLANEVNAGANEIANVFSN